MKIIIFKFEIVLNNANEEILSPEQTNFGKNLQEFLE